MTTIRNVYPYLIITRKQLLEEIDQKLFIDVSIFNSFTLHF